MPSKIKIKTIQYRTSRILEVKEDEYIYEKTSPRIGFMQYFIRDILRKMFCLNFKALYRVSIRFLKGDKSFGVGRELEKTCPATYMH